MSFVNFGSLNHRLSGRFAHPNGDYILSRARLEGDAEKWCVAPSILGKMCDLTVSNRGRM